MAESRFRKLEKGEGFGFVLDKGNAEIKCTSSTSQAHCCVELNCEDERSADVCCCTECVAQRSETSAHGGKPADRRVVDAMDASRPPGVPMTGPVEDLATQLRVMAEDRDEYQRKYQGVCGNQLEPMREKIQNQRRELDRFQQKRDEDKAALEAMTENRDRYQDRCHAMGSSVSIEVANIRRLLEPANMDERAIAHAFVLKLMTEGRIEHGPLNLAADERNLLHEAGDELDDTIAYLLMERRRIELRKVAAK